MFFYENGISRRREEFLLPQMAEVKAQSLFSSDIVIVKSLRAEFPPKMLVLSIDNGRIPL